MDWGGGRAVPVNPPDVHSPVKSESEHEVAQSCRTLCDPVDCGPPVSSAHAWYSLRFLNFKNFSLFMEVMQRFIKIENPLL